VEIEIVKFQREEMQSFSVGNSVLITRTVQPAEISINYATTNKRKDSIHLSKFSRGSFRNREKFQTFFI
jgi:hypothetical protein